MKNMQTLNRELKMAELERIKMEAEKLRAETVKLQKEANWFPWLSLAVALIALIVALVK
ncbi:hypothetical protein [Moraxella phage Mcat17]|uniref:hypothetical protein n=1 Tax=Moraxella catarrhalis TaxID=480 RepID=UPI00071F5747|nr:hypothetical protein [Moraxella catarrhalis]AKI27691.1 hypothetical protein [Moraxella phage Mcat17]DAX96601.1 MAG TPA: Sigma-M inhibitor [Caudoviricetes sp.]OAV06024.1 hypothetical protein AO379_1100 [Moraxella catarrhalis]OAV07016.1 hypothetical protein AO381_0171 [Moraxella catarrhalis]OAV18448.1 hypothetical protein AO373_1032 [Moraxella catarrhalis]